MPITALLIVDMQNDNIHADGAFAGTGAAAHAASQDVISNVRSVLDAARSADIPVFHNKIVVHPNPAIGGANAPIFRMLGPESLKLGSWGAAIVDEITPIDGEIVLDRIRMNAFGGTSLDIMLRNLGVADVIVVGVWTNMAVEHTIRDAADRGYTSPSSPTPPPPSTPTGNTPPSATPSPIVPPSPTPRPPSPRSRRAPGGRPRRRPRHSSQYRRCRGAQHLAPGPRTHLPDAAGVVPGAEPADDTSK